MKLKATQCATVGALTFLVFLPLSCGKNGGGASSSENASTSRSKGPELKLMEVSTELSPSSDQQLQLALTTTPTASMGEGLELAAPGGQAVDSYVMNLSGCSSGLTGNNGTAGQMNVYLHDSNCLAKLTSFVLHGQSYVPTGSGAVAFTAWSVGSTAIFQGASSSDLINLRVVSQLSSPIVTTDVVSYNYTIIKSGTNNASITVSNTQTLYVAGTDAPNFKINSGGITFNNIVSSGGSQGAGIFTFNLICTTGAMTVGANSSYNSYCPDVTAGGTIAGGASGVDVGANFSYKLIADSNGNGTLTLAQAQSAFSAGGDTTVTLSTDILSGSTGFQTQQLTGPGPIASNAKMILVLQAKNTNSTYTSNTAYSSFQYFAVTLPTVSP